LADIKELGATRRQKEIVGMAGKLEAAASGEERTEFPQRNVQTRHDFNFG
jgi:hypothetical protein